MNFGETHVSLLCTLALWAVTLKFPGVIVQIMICFSQRKWIHMLGSFTRKMLWNTSLPLSRNFTKHSMKKTLVQKPQNNDILPAQILKDPVTRTSMQSFYDYSTLPNSHNLKLGHTVNASGLAGWSTSLSPENSAAILLWKLNPWQVASHPFSVSSNFCPDSHPQKWSP